MAAVARHHPSTDYFTSRTANQAFNSVSPTSPYFPFDAQADYDSLPSPDSPLSLVFTNPYQLPSHDEDWLAWDGQTLSPDFDILAKSQPPRHYSISPAVNPLVLSTSVPEDVGVAFGRGGLADTQPLFQSLQQKTMPAESLSRPMPAAPTSPVSDRQSRSRKRKSSSPASPTRSSASPPPHGDGESPHKKTTHNVIEKRYRTNLNDKIAALRDSVPSLRIMARRLEHSASSDDAEEEELDEDLVGLTPAHKLNKATILSKATEYISHLERRNKNLAKENAVLRDRVQGFEMLVVSSGRTGPSSWMER
jgi:hypothetical protein